MAARSMERWCAGVLLWATLAVIGGAGCVPGNPAATGIARTAMERRHLPPRVVPIAPAPGHTVSGASAQTYVAARLAAAAPIARVALWLDGAPATPALLGPDARHLSLFYRPRGWSGGWHRVRIAAWDRSGAVGQIAWRFRIGRTRA
jgi:hypothetical protein